MPVSKHLVLDTSEKEREKGGTVQVGKLTQAVFVDATIESISSRQ